MIRFAWVAAAASLLGTGCLSTSYTIERDELARLAHTPPDARGQQVRVTQDLSFESDPPPAHDSPPVRTDVELSVALSIAASHHPHRHHGPRGAVHVQPAGGSSSPEGEGSSGSEGSSSSSSGSSGGGDGPSAALVAVMVVASAGIGIALAATEGSRFDGWVGLDREHPVHLEGPDGEHVWVPLAGLDPGLAAWAVDARITEEEGPTRFLARAPLDRQGFAYTFELGAASVGTVDRDGALAFATRTQFGFFPVHEVGLLLGLGAGANGDIVEWRPHLELQAFPLAIDPVHVGLYAQGGYATGVQDVPDGPDVDVDGWYFGGGALVQLDVTTRFAITFRGGAMLLTNPGETQLAPEFTIGLAVY
jgi:hypothetical protein